MYQADPHFGTFVQPGVQAKGIGGAMFNLTCRTLRERDVPYIIAHIRADNIPGLAYYARIGLRDIGQALDLALGDGRKVGRVH